MQAFDLLGLQAHRGIAPAEADVRVVRFAFGKFADRMHESERLAEISEFELALDALGVVMQLPLRHLTVETFGLLCSKRRDATLAGCAGLLSQRVDHDLAPDLLRLGRSHALLD